MNICVFYHCLIAGPRIPSRDNSIAILAEQMNALKQSGLADVADEIHIGFNGTDSDALTVCGFIPERSTLHVNHNGESELATMHILQEWLRPGWFVFYHHIKGIQYPMKDVRHDWRRRMEHICVWSWQSCVAALERNNDTCGGRWHTPNRMQKYWPGNFWWAKSDYLLTLPGLAPDTHENRYEAEVWIGKGPVRPRVHDFQPAMRLF